MTFAIVGVRKNEPLTTEPSIQSNNFYMETAKILRCSWGYSMTIVDFAMVVRETEKCVFVLPMKNNETEEGFLYGRCTPGEVCKESDGYKVSRLLKKTSEKYGDKYYVGKYYSHANSDHGRERSYFRDWDGKPESFNHCD